ncbi:hypothetical protein FB45DRAFT_979023 [Roridomyces roridus]|uniref:Mg-dependent DNase n=1 Tax=Roridomyces roridus TaxID=1738132 RepID=A0AAD7FP91_9AGAR|nr:hypothetical protein FB45DRAFT_979023 [Roridomyces roridus]
MTNPPVSRPSPTFIDIAINLTDPVFRGTYHSKKKHEDDLLAVLDRASQAGVEGMIITGTSLSESQEALNLAKELGPGFYCTVGCHPTRSTEFEGGPDAYLAALDQLIAENLQGKGRVVAVGECGLDYDRLHFASAEIQQKYFRVQLSLSKKYNLPLFLHSRACHTDFVKILREEGFGAGGGGVVHSFTGSLQEMTELMDMGFHIGVNGCSLKTNENLNVAKAIRLDRLMLETDAPWCSMTGGHASKHQLASLPPLHRELYFPPSTKPENFTLGKTVKGRNEPCAVGGVAWIVSQLHDVPLQVVAEVAFKNTMDLFHLDAISTIQ